MRKIMLAALLLLPAVAAAQTAPGVPDRVRQDPRYGLLTPLPDHGGVPAIVSMLDGPSEQELAIRARSREYARQLAAIRREHFGRIRVPEIRTEGIEQLREFTDPAAFQPMIETFAREEDDVRLAMLDHFTRLGDDGQAALAFVAVRDVDDALRNEAMRRMVSPPAAPVLRVLDAALRSRDHRLANNAGWLAGAIGAVEAIPLLIFAQVAPEDPPEEKGDLAWIAVDTQIAFVSDLVPVVGDSSGAFMPVVSTVSDGFVLRVEDAVVVVYRTAVHRSLVALSTRQWGDQPTDQLGYDMGKWWAWYNEEYVPYVNERAREEGEGTEGQGD